MNNIPRLILALPCFVCLAAFWYIGFRSIIRHRWGKPEERPKWRRQFKIGVVGISWLTLLSGYLA